MVGTWIHEVDEKFKLPILEVGEDNGGMLAGVDGEDALEVPTSSRQDDTMTSDDLKTKMTSKYI